MPIMVHVQDLQITCLIWLERFYIRPMPVHKEGDPRTVGIGGTATSVTKQSEALDIAKKVVAEAKLTKS